MRYGIAVLGTKDGTIVSGDEDVWVRTYDPDADEVTLLEFTDDAYEALIFPTRHQALETILRVSTERPCNREGKLNRPLSDDYAVEVRELPETT